MGNGIMTAIRVLSVAAAISTFAIPSLSAQEGKTATPGIGPSASSQAERVVQEQVEAYNRHDLEGFLKHYSPDIKLYDFPDKEVGSGLDSMRERYGRLFRQVPDLRVEITKRIVQGDTIIDQESGSSKAYDFKAVAIYRVKDRKIVAVWFIR